METYFNNDPRIRKWINQIIERIFTVCILTGVDSDEEFQKGCQVVMELASLLQDIATFPPEVLEDGVKQLLEQQLPDPLVINNFPEFKVIMDRMLNEGIMKATNSTEDISLQYNDSYIDSSIQTKADEEALAEAHAQVEAHKAEAERLAEALAQALAQAEAKAKADKEALAEALAQVEAHKADAERLAEALAQAEVKAKADEEVLAEALAQVEAHKADAERLDEAHAQALAQAEAKAKADEEALAEALAQVEAHKADEERLAEAHAQALAQAEAKAKADEEALAEALAQVEAHKTNAERLAGVLAQAEVKAKADEKALTEALAQVETQAKVDALAIADALAQVERSLDALIKIEHYEVAKPMPDTNDITVPALLTSINSKISQVISAPLIPQKADLLGKVLSNIFPMSTVYWNKSLMGQTFLAQVEDILIYLCDPEHPCDLKKVNKDGWKVLVCSNEDLAFPRRLEREIRQILRSKKRSSTV